MTKTTVSLETLQRPLRPDDGQGLLFDTGDSWAQYWWGMPSYCQGDARPRHTIKVNLLTHSDFLEFCEKLGMKLSAKADSIWYPPRDRLKNSEYVFTGPKVDTRYPVYIMTKGRADCMTTPRVLGQLGVRCTLFVEETEVDAYEATGNHVVRLPFHDLGQGSIPARNFIWEYAQERGHERYWLMDDNIVRFYRCTHNRRVPCHSGGLLRAIEDFADRYDNLAFAGPSADGFANDVYPGMAPVTFNTRVYSCTLITTSVPLRWRGRYNEDTDLCLRALKAGWATVLFRSLLMKKFRTSDGASGAAHSGMKGGNTDHVYNTDDYRLRFAESLKEQHPDVVKVIWRYGRWHHSVDYTPFRNNKPILREGITPVGVDNEYGMELVHQKQTEDKLCD